MTDNETARELIHLQALARNNPVRLAAIAHAKELLRLHRAALAGDVEALMLLLAERGMLVDFKHGHE